MSQSHDKQHFTVKVMAHWKSYVIPQHIMQELNVHVSGQVACVHQTLGLHSTTHIM